MISAIIRTAFCAAAIASTVAADKLPDHSFEPPFAEVDNAGLRLVHKQWKTSGSAVVNANFARLTPDRQSKKGALWSKKALGVDTFSAILKFRISGQGKNFFGDGIGFWISQNSYWKEGDLHGINEKFVGVGIIFDTFKNTENLAAHRDVTVIVNDGEKTWEMMTADVQGCQANVRYHNDRADFSVSDASRAKVVVENRELSVFIDPTNSGDWTECVKLSNIALPDYWARRAHVGLTASTGQLADNHDIISLSAFLDSDPAELDAVELSAANKRLFPTGDDLSGNERILRLENAINDILVKLDFFDHHTEHEFASVNDHILNMLGKIEKREDKSETRIDTIEENIRNNVEGALKMRITAVENQIKATVDNKLRNMNTDIASKMESTLKEASNSSGGWKLPFLILVVFIAAAGVGLYLYYQHLKKIHLL